MLTLSFYVVYLCHGFTPSLDTEAWEQTLLNFNLAPAGILLSLAVL